MDGMDRATCRWRGKLSCAATVIAMSAAGSVGTGQAAAADYGELYRPQFHFTPSQHWMNDPNGLVYHDGEYHLFFQHNPFGSSWGHMSWGHAVSRDLVHWRQLPVAIPEADGEMVFSGSAVVDRENTTGFGTKRNPAMVAIYTAARAGSQAQALAYSTDRGRSWTRYAGNPVLDIGSGEFRDPKVFWYAPERKWVMVVVKALEHRVQLYSSPDLKQWTHMSDFGPANAVGGAWECPDLFPLRVDGDPSKTKWVMLVSLNPGAIAGGSGMQYFVGSFDGTTFRADNAIGAYTPPAGDVLEDFEHSGYGDWTLGGTAFGVGPATGNVTPQGGVAGFAGERLANSFHDEDRGTGTLTSPDFTLDRPYLNFLVGGGRHPHETGTVDGAPPPGTVFADFEGEGYGQGWTATGTFNGTQSAAGTLPGQQPVSGYEGARLVNTFVEGDAGTGRITSPEFTIAADRINFLVGGGSHPYPGDASNPPAAVNLVVDGDVVRSATGADSEALNWTSWDVAALRGRVARIEIVDEHTGGWGHINADHFMFAAAPASPRSTETAVNLLVDGDVVRTATGGDSETLDWTSWHVGDLTGRRARIQIVDRNTGGWGHILADRFMLADAAAQSVLERSSWVDFGKDHYAAVTFNDAPGGRRIAIGWMNNWSYSGAIPTSPWRSAMSVPRELKLQTIDGALRLVSAPVAELRALRGPEWASKRMGRLLRADTSETVPVRGKALELDIVLRVGTSGRAGLKVRTGAGGEETVIGYDAGSRELYVDRRASGADGFSRDFAREVQRAPLPPRDGKVRFRVLVDWSSVEVFGDRGQVVLSDQIYPSADSDGVALFTERAGAVVESLRAWPLRSIWTESRRRAARGSNLLDDLSDRRVFAVDDDRHALQCGERHLKGGRPIYPWGHPFYVCDP